MNEETLIAQEVSDASFLYQPHGVEGLENTEKINEYMQRRTDLMGRIAEADKMHNAMISYEHECSQKTRDLVRSRRRLRESHERSQEALAQSREARRKPKPLEGEDLYKAQLEATYDNPKSKLRTKKTKTKPEAPDNFILVPEIVQEVTSETLQGSVPETVQEEV